MVKNHFPSRNLNDYGIIRMHEYKTCEISLLSGPNSSVRSSKKTMHSLQKDLVHSSKETRASDYSDLSQSLGSNFFARLHASTASPSSTACGLVKFSPPVSPSAQPFCRSTLSSKNTVRVFNFISRRTLLFIPQKALGFVLNSTQILPRKNSHLSRPCPSSRQGRGSSLETSFLNNTSEGPTPHKSPCSGQSQWYEAYRETRKLAPPTLPFSSHSEIPNSISPWQTRPQRWKSERRNLSVDSSNPRNLRRIDFQLFTRSIKPNSSNVLWHSTHSSYGARFSSICPIFPNVSSTSKIKLTYNNQYHRINVLHYSRFTSTQPLCFQSSVTSQMDNGINSTAAKFDLQWQASSTDLINSTPICDIP